MFENQTDANILVVDDDAIIRRVLTRIIGRANMRCDAVESAEQALDVLQNESFDVVVTDVHMDGMNGIELCRRIRRGYDTDVIVMTGLAADIHYDVMIREGASDFIQKPFRHPEFIARLRRVLWGRETLAERNTALEEAQMSLARMRRALQGIVHSISRTIEMKDPYTAGHQLRVADMACLIGEELGMTEERLRGVRVAATLHDIGKMNVPSEILNRPGKLSDLELELVRGHVDAGVDILHTIDFPWPVAEAVHQHHERVNGSGYPRAVAGDEILLEARIVAVSDVFESISSHRPYRASRGTRVACQELTQGRGVLYDAAVVDACLKLHDRGQLAAMA